MMRLLWFGMLVLISGCSRWYTDATQWDSKSIAITAPVTYAWSDTVGATNFTSAMLTPEIIGQWMKPLVDSALLQAGWQKIPPGAQPDVLLDFYILVRSEVITLVNQAPYAQEWYQRGVYLNKPHYALEHNLLLLLRIRQHSGKQDVWAGWATGKSRGELPSYSDIKTATRLVLSEWRSLLKAS